MKKKEPDQPEAPITYTILNRDDHGNWTQRKVSKSDGTTQKREILITNKLTSRRK